MSSLGAGPGSNRYKLLSRAGRGACGEVYQAQDRTLGRVVALKLLQAAAHLRGRPEFQRFFREARILAGSPHPALVPLLDFVPESDPPYLVLAWMEGGDLLSRMEARGALPLKQLIRLGSRMAGALEYLHGQAILHRDLKPANVLLDEHGDFFLADLGLARDSKLPGLTQTGMVVGTPQYVAPETVSLGEYSPVSDLFSLGAVLLEAYRGAVLPKPALDLESTQGILREVEPPELRRILRRCLMQDPDRRIQDATTLRTAFQQIDPEASAVPPDPEDLAELDQEEDSDSTLDPDATQDLGLSALVAPARVQPSGPPPARGLRGRNPPGGAPGGDGPSPWASRRLGLALGIALGLALVGWVLLPVRSPVPLAPTTPLPPTAPASGSPVGADPAELADLPRLLEAELDALLATPVDDQLRPASPPRGRPFLERYHERGAALLRHLPQQQRFHDWLDAGGRPWELPPELLRELRAYDRSCADVGMAPPFHPFLEARPREVPYQTGEVLGAHPRLSRDLSGSIERPRSGWAGAFLLHFEATLRAYEELWRDLAEEGEAPPFSRLREGRAGYRGVLSHPLENTLIRDWLRGRTLGERLAAGRDQYRCALYAAFRASDAAPEDTPWIERLVIRSEDPLLGLLQGPAITGSPRQLLGPRCRNYRGLLLEAAMIRRIRTRQRRLFLSGGAVADLEIDPLREAFRLSQLPGSRESGQKAWISLLIVLEKRGHIEELERLRERHEATMLPLLSPDQLAMLAGVERRLAAR